MSHSICVLIGLAAAAIFIRRFEPPDPIRPAVGVFVLTYLSCAVVAWVIRKMSESPAEGLISAAGAGRLAELREMLRTVDVNAPSGGITALMEGAARGRIEIVEELLKAGANKSLTNPHGLTALQLAAQSGHMSVVALLEDLPKPSTPPPTTAAVVAAQPTHDDLAEIAPVVDPPLSPRLKLDAEERILYQEQAKYAPMIRAVTNKRVIEHRLSTTDGPETYREDFLDEIEAIHIPLNLSGEGDKGDVYLVGKDNLHTFVGGASDKQFLKVVEYVSTRIGCPVQRLRIERNYSAGLGCAGIVLGVGALLALPVTWWFGR